MGLLGSSEEQATSLALTERGALSPAVGKILTSNGPATIMRADGSVVPVEAGALLHQGDVIETGDDGRVGIAFEDGTAFDLSSNSRIALAEFGYDSGKALHSALVRVSQGRFAFRAGAAATRGGVSIETPFATLRSGAMSGALVTLTLAAVTVALLQKLEAASNEPILLDDLIKYKDLEHGTLGIVPKGGERRLIILDDPEMTIIIGPPETGYTVQEILNSSAVMSFLLAVSQEANAIYLLGQADPFTTGSIPGQRADSGIIFFPDTPVRPVNFFQPLPALDDNDPPGGNSPNPPAPNAPPPPPPPPGQTLVFTPSALVLSQDETPGQGTEIPFPIDLTGIPGPIIDLGRMQNGSSADPFISTAGSNFTGTLVIIVEASTKGVYSGLDVTGGDSIFLFTETIDGRQVVVGREGTDGVDAEDGPIAFIIFVTEDGQTLWVQQTLPIDHGDDGNDFDSSLPIANDALLVRGTVTGGGPTLTQTLPIGNQVAFEDDGPVAQNDSARAEVETETTLATVNALIILDTSGSMGSASVSSSRISLAKAAILDFAAQDNVLSIRILPFDSSADTPSVWFDLTDDHPVTGGYAQLQAFLAGITGNGTTNYEDAIYDAQQTWTAPPNVATLDNVYFISDGEPTVRSNIGSDNGNVGGSGSSAGLTVQEVAGWEAFLIANGIDNAYAVGIGASVNNLDLQEVAYPNTPNQTNNVIIIDSAGDLNSTLQDTIQVPIPTTLPGNVIDNAAEDDLFGSDGPGFVKSLRWDSNGDGVLESTDDIYSFDGTDIFLNNNVLAESGTSEITFETAFGGEMHFDFITGDWDYTTPDTFDSEFVEHFAYTITDGDGDESVPATLDITVGMPEVSFNLQQLAIATGNNDLA